MFSDSARYATHGEDVTAETLRLFHTVASAYRSAPTKYEMNLVLKGHYIFDSSDPYHAETLPNDHVKVVGQDGLLQQFLNYVTKHYHTFPTYDLAVLLSGRTFENKIRGLATVSGMCDHPAFRGVIAQPTYPNHVLNSNVIAHEIGHTLSSHHDGQNGSPNMDCDSKEYIMAPHVNTNTQFSSCSIELFNTFMDASTCLYNNPETTPIREAKLTDPYYHAHPLNDPNKGRPGSTHI